MTKHGPGDPQPVVLLDGCVSPWYQGLTLDHIYPQCPGRVRSLPELVREGTARPCRTALDPEGGDVCGWCLRLWRSRSAAPTVEYLRELARVDWVVSRSWNRLHWVDLPDDQLRDLEDECVVTGPVVLACGRTAASVSIPGLFTRLGASRCVGCCRVVGLPPGVGSPKNDAACRRILGLGESRYGSNARSYPAVVVPGVPSGSGTGLSGQGTNTEAGARRGAS